MNADSIHLDSSQAQTRMLLLALFVLALFVLRLALGLAATPANAEAALAGDRSESTGDRIIVHGIAVDPGSGELTPGSAALIESVAAIVAQSFDDPVLLASCDEGQALNAVEDDLADHVAGIAAAAEPLDDVRCAWTDRESFVVREAPL